MTARASGGIWLGLILLALPLWASCQGLRAYDSTTRTIRLREAPVPVTCRRGPNLVPCVLLLRDDWEALVIAYKAQCLQLGGSPAQCQTLDPSLPLDTPR